MLQIRKKEKKNQTTTVIIYIYILYREAICSRGKKKKADREGLLKHHLLKAMPYVASEGL